MTMLKTEIMTSLSPEGKWSVLRYVPPGTDVKYLWPLGNLAIWKLPLNEVSLVIISPSHPYLFFIEATPVI